MVLMVVGWVFAIASAWLIYTALQMEIAVAAPGVAESGLLPQGMDSVVNLQLLHTQAMLIHLGIGAAVVSAFFLTGAAIIVTLRRHDPAADLAAGQI